MESINTELSVEDIKTKLDNLKYIKNSEINKYLELDKSEIKYGNIAHLYFHLSVEVYKILSSKIYIKICRWKFKSSGKLKKAYEEILVVFNLINAKEPLDKSDRKESRDSIFQNKNHLLNSLNHYNSIMTSVENRMFNIFTISISAFALFFSIFYPIVLFKT